LPGARQRSSRLSRKGAPGKGALLRIALGAMPEWGVDFRNNWPHSRIMVAPHLSIQFVCRTFAFAFAIQRSLPPG
jgi:hypothetical protein